MGTTKELIEEWFDDGVAQNKSHLLVVCDTFDYDDYPVYTTKDKLNETIEKYDGKDMQKIMEIYDLSKDKLTQLNTARCWSI